MSTKRAERKASPLFELPRVLVRFDHVASYFQTAGQFLKRRESKKVSHFRELGFVVSVEKLMKGRVFFPHGAGSLAARQETRNIGF